MGSRTYTPEQRIARAARTRRWYEANQERILDRLRNRTEEERAKVREYAKTRYHSLPAVREQIKVASEKYRKAHPDRVAAYQAKYMSSPEAKAIKRAALLRKFHLTPDQYDVMLTEQGGVCAICREPETRQHRGYGSVIALAVDHDHRCCPDKGSSCGKCIRGLLCDRCNLCRFPDDARILRAAADYFERYARS